MKDPAIGCQCIPPPMARIETPIRDQSVVRSATTVAAADEGGMEMFVSLNHWRRGSVLGMLAVAVVLLLLAVSPTATASPVIVTNGNDFFATATVIGSLPYTDSPNTALATTEPGDPECAGNGHTVWYEFTPSTDIEIEVSTFGSDYDTTLSAYDEEMNQVACVDDAAGALQSRIRFTALAGETYHIMVGSFYDTPGGNLELLVREAPPLGPPPELSIQIDPSGSVNRAGVATIRGTVTCSEPVEAFIEVFVRQTVSRPIAEGFGFGGVSCDGPTTWEAEVFPYTGAFSAGVANVSTYTSACDADELCGDASSSRSVVLRIGPR